VILVSFADRRYRNHLRRLERQANELGLHRQVLTYSESDLSKDFRRRHKDILRRDVRGFGYWIWKPYVIQKALSLAQPGELVNYLDAGFFINTGGASRFREYVELAEQSEQGVLGFKSVPPSSRALLWDGRPLPVWKNREWTKSLLLKRFNLRDDHAFLDDVTFEAGAMFVQNSPAGKEFIKSWLDLMESDYALIDDTVSPDGEADDFRGHRHDQACFNILAHRNDIPFVSSREFWYPEATTGRPDWDAHPGLPLQARRIRRKSLRKRMKKRYRGFFVSLRSSVSIFLKRR